ncbi:MAG: hypothetical protein AB1791_20350 [Chloroflexota bacterium]
MASSKWQVLPATCHLPPATDFEEVYQMIMIAQSGRVAADGAIVTRPGHLHAVCLAAAAGAAATLILYDNASAASGTRLLTLTAPAGESICFTPGVAWPFVNGVYADIGGASAEATILYS